MGLFELIFSRTARADWIMRRLSRRLALSPGQRIHLLYLRERILLLHNEVCGGWDYQKGKLPGLLEGESINRKQALRLAGVPVAMVSDSLPTLVDAMADFYETLNPEQRARVREIVGQWSKAKSP